LSSTTESKELHDITLWCRIVDKEQKRIYIIMEHCANGDLTKLIKRCKAEKDFVAEDVIWKIFY